MAASAYVREWIRNHVPVECATDYGCGKLRYTLELASISKRVFAVDSEVQLNRKQTIHGVAGTTIISFLQGHRNIVPQSVSQFESDGCKSQLVLCINVLSAVPCFSERALLMKRVARALTPT
jgi:hypothetical protein